MKPLLLPALALAAPAAAQTTSPVTSDVGHLGASSQPSISADGRLVAYESPGSSSPGDTCIDVHVRDLDTGVVTAVTACDSTATGPAWPSRHPALSGDGTCVAYERLGGSPLTIQVHVAGAAGVVPAEVASLSDAGFTADSACYYPALSHDATHVAFHSTATNLVAGAPRPGNVHNVYVRDRAAGRTVCASATLAGAPSADGHSQYASVSADGRYVAFESVAEDLVAAGLDTNGTQDVYVRDRDPDGNGVLDEGNAVTALITRDAAGLAVGGHAPALSADGRHVAFLSYAADLAGVQTNKVQVHVADRDPDEDGDLSNTPPAFDVTSRSSLGAIADDWCLHPSISADGRLVAFSSRAGNLVPNDDGDHDAFLFDREKGQIARVSVDSYGTAGDDDSTGTWYSDDPAVAADGSRLAFSSRATNLVPGDANGLEDVFAHDVCLPVGVDLGFALAGTGGLRPTLTACGDLAPGGTALLRLRDALPSAPAWLVGAPTAVPIPLAGGTLVPVPPLFSIGLTTDALGGIELGLNGAPGPLSFFVQYLVLDPGAPMLLALSNAFELRF